MSAGTGIEGALQSCAKLLCASSARIEAVSVCNDEGFVTWLHGDTQPTSERDNKEVLSVLVEEITEDMATARALDDRQYLAAGRINGLTGPNDLYLVLQVAGDDMSYGISLVDMARGLLGRLLDANSELDAMADELSRRYDELNLVYEADEEISHISETRSALAGMVENCSEYLDVDISALIVPAEDDSTKYLHKCVRNGSEETVPDGLNKNIFDWVTTHGEVLVLNSSNEHKQAGMDSAIKHKLVASPVQDDSGRMLAVLAVMNDAARPDFENSDRSLMRVMGRRVAKIMSASYDSMTGLMNRESFVKAVGRSMRLVHKKQKEACLLHINIDRTQLVNDTLGHEVGDRLIVEVAEMIRSHLRTYDHIARIGGDEFGVLLDACKHEDALKLAGRLGSSVTGIECGADSQRLDVGISTGIVSIDESFESVVGLLAAADLACSKAKDDGRGRAVVYSKDDRDMQDRKTQMHLVSDIQDALKCDRFVLFSQLIDAVDPERHAPHFEILLRMLGHDDRILSPGFFMPVAERYHMMPLIDQWVIDHSLTAIETFTAKYGGPKVVFAINLSGLSLTDRRTLEFVLRRLRESTTDTSQICFEITETAAISNLENAKKFIAQVRNFGCKFAMDDFGAGVSSFSNLRALDLDYVKIDGSFVCDMTTDPVCEAMVTAINQVGQTMQLGTVAEFVETPETAARLKAIGVNFLQGYGIAKPRPFNEQLAELLAGKVRSA